MQLFLNNIIALIFFIGLQITAPPSHANEWPVFTVPDKTFLMDKGYIDTSQCPQGQAKLATNVLINVKQNLCKTFCPKNWSWIISNKGACHPLDTDFSLQSIEIIHYPDHDGDDGAADYSIVIASYGKENSSSAFKFLMLTEPGLHWYCIEDNPLLHTIVCDSEVFNK